MQRTERVAPLPHGPLDDLTSLMRALRRDRKDLSIHSAEQKLKAIREGITDVNALSFALFELCSPGDDHRSPAEHIQDTSQHDARC